jgi:hypothetical protein
MKIEFIAMCKGYGAEIFNNCRYQSLQLIIPDRQLRLFRGFSDNGQFDFINTDVNYSRLLTKLLWVADPYDIGRRPGVKAFRVAQQMKIKAKSLQLVYQALVRQTNLEAQMLAIPKWQPIYGVATVSTNECHKLLSQTLPRSECAH